MSSVCVCVCVCIFFYIFLMFRLWIINETKRLQSTGRFSANFLVNSSAFLINFFLSLLYSENCFQVKYRKKRQALWRKALPSARSFLSGCSGSGSLTSATRAWITWSVFVAGFQCSEWIIGRQICPFSSIFGW